MPRRRTRHQPGPGLPLATDSRHDPPAGRLLIAGLLILAAAVVGFGLYPDVLRRHLLTVRSDQGPVRVHPDAAVAPRPAGPPRSDSPSGGPGRDRGATELTLIFSGGLRLTTAAAGAELAPLGSLLSSADLAVCQGPTPTGRPEPVAEALRRAGFDACATATSDTAQLGDADIRSLLDALDGASISHSGSARDRAEAATLTLLPVRGAQIALLSATDSAGSTDSTGATDGTVDRLDPALILRNAARARDAGADLVIAALDWGGPRPTEPTEPTDRQRATARELLDSPLIDLVVGSGSGAVQPFESINGKYVAYGTSAATPGGSTGTGSRRDGLLLHVLLRSTGLGWLIAGLAYSPVWTSDDGTVLPVADALDDPGTPAALRPELTASWLRTVAAVTALGPVDGVRPDRTPRHTDARAVPAAPDENGTPNETTDKITG